MDLGLSGLASGFDWRSLVDQLSNVERAPQRLLRQEQTTLNQRNTAYGNILAQLTTLKTKVDALKEPALFDAHLAAVGDTSIATATVSSQASVGTYTFDIVQLATASAQQGIANVGQKLNADNDVSGLVLSDANFGATVTGGTFTINGKRVTIETTDTLQAVFDKINTATGGDVTATYDSPTDKIALSGSGEIILGSATDTSNFLSVAKLYNNGTNAVSSDFALGVVRQSATLANANLATAIDDGGSGAGEFKINGVSINFDASTDTVADVLARINNSAAGVTASYDSINDRFVLTNKTTGDVGIALEDVTGNFLAATQLSTGALSRGHNLLYTVDGGGQLVSQSNTITEASSGIAGLSLTALKEDTTTVSVNTDTEKIKKAITDFIAEYNKAQKLIDTQTASSTDAKGKVTAGILANDSDASEIAARLRRLANTVVSGLSGSISQLASLGIDSNGTDDTLVLSDSATLDAALAENLSAVKDLFSESTNGIAAQLGSYLERTAGDEGALETKQDNLTKQSADIDSQITDLERLVQANEERLINSFLAMEQAQAKINQQIQFLAQRFGSQ